jgi:hypothetical protein
MLNEVVAQRPAHLWKPGQSANPAGIDPIRLRVAKKCTRALFQDFKEHGRKAIQEMREKHPDKYVLAILGLFPKSVEVSGNINHTHLHASVSDPQAWLTSIIQGTTAPQLDQAIAATALQGISEIVEPEASEEVDAEPTEVSA